MAQKFIIENTMLPKVNFSNVNIGDLFIYNDNICIKIEHNRLNYIVLDTGELDKLNNTVKVVLPKSVLLKLE